MTWSSMLNITVEAEEEEEEVRVMTSSVMVNQIFLWTFSMKLSQRFASLS